MCGRFASFRQAQDLADAFALAFLANDAVALPPSWNVAPTDPVRLVVERPERLADGSDGPLVRQLRLARWGLVPSWAKDVAIGSKLVNARSETLAEKPAFRRAFAARRGLVPAEGYYEWQARPAGPKQPFFVHPADDGVLALAALYEFWADPALARDDPARWVVSTTIVTRDASPGLATLHHREPVMLPRESWDAWLDPATTTPAAAELLRLPAPDVTLRPVARTVGRVNENGPELISPVEADLPEGPATLG